MSKTYNLINDDRWASLQIEPNGDRFIKLASRYLDRFDVTCLQKEVHPISSSECKIDYILNTTDCPKNFDLLVIDVDGEDMAIWESMQQFKPMLVVIEFNAYKFKDDKGVSLREINHLAIYKGYQLIAVAGYSCGVNAFFIQKELFQRFSIESNNVSNFINLDGSLVNFE